MQHKWYKRRCNSWRAGQEVNWWLTGQAGLFLACLRPTLAVFPAGLLDDWHQDRPTGAESPPDPSPPSSGQSGIYPESWVALLKNTNSRIIRILGLKVMKWEVGSEAGARVILELGLLPILANISLIVLSATAQNPHKKIKLKRELMGILASLAQYDFCNETLTSADWLALYGAMAVAPDAEVAKSTSEVIRRLTTHQRLSAHVPYTIDIVKQLLSNRHIEGDGVVQNAAATLVYLASNSDADCRTITKSLLPLVQQSGRRQPSEAVQVEVARLLHEALKCTSNRKMITNDGWAEFLGFWSRSNDKGIKLATAQIIGEAVKDEEVAIRLLSDYGVQLVLDVASGLDIEVQTAVQRTIAQLASSQEITDQREDFTYFEDVQLDDNFLPTSPSSTAPVTLSQQY